MTDKEQATLPKDAVTYFKTVLKTADPEQSNIYLAAYNVPNPDETSEKKTVVRHLVVKGSNQKSKIAKFINDFDKVGDGVYACVGRLKPDATKATKSTVSTLTTIQADFDRMDKGTVIARLRELEIQPTIVIDSGNGIHAYWCLETALDHTDENRELVEETNHQICVKLGADVACKNIDRRMRLPGTTHTKDKSDIKPCFIIEMNEEERYSIEELSEFFNSLPVAPIPLAKGQKEKTTLPNGKRLTESAALGMDIDELTEIITEIGAPLHPAVIAMQAKMIGKGFPVEEVSDHIDKLLRRCPRQDRVAEGYANGEWQSGLDTASEKYHNPIKEMQFQATRGELSEDVVKEEQAAKEDEPAEKGSTKTKKNIARIEPEQLRKLIAKYAKQKDYWPDGTVKDGHAPVCGDWNIAVALHRMGYRFRYNKRFHYMEYINILDDDKTPKRFDDSVLVTLPAQLRMTLHMSPRPSKEVVDQVVNYVAKGRQHCPVQQYIDNLPDWDGVDRLSTFFADYMSAEVNEVQSATYLQGVARCAFVGSIMRAVEPGSKMDTMVVLVGEQGCFKSTSIQTLYSVDPDYFGLYASHHIDWDDKDKVVEQIVGPWGVEHDELAGLRFKEAEAMKGGLSRQVDICRPKYGRYVKEFLRMCVIWGTTNNDDFLSDDTGNRRIQPVRIKKGEFIDLAALSQDRQQLWAEALARYHKGEKNYLLPDEVKTTVTVHASHTYDDPLNSIVAKKLNEAEPLREGKGLTIRPSGDGWNELTMSRDFFLKEVLMKSDDDIGRINRPEMRRYNASMKSVGWDTGVYYVDGKSIRGFRQKRRAEI